MLWKALIHPSPSSTRAHSSAPAPFLELSCHERGTSPWLSIEIRMFEFRSIQDVLLAVAFYLHSMKGSGGGLGSASAFKHCSKREQKKKKSSCRPSVRSRKQSWVGAIGKRETGKQRRAAAGRPGSSEPAARFSCRRL